METNGEMRMKKCSKCGRELPISEFYRNRTTKDGYTDRCKECHNEEVKKSKAKRVVIAAKTGYAAPEPPKVTPSDSATVERKVLNGAADKVYAHPELARFSPRQLIEELRERGYRGKLTYTMEVVL